MPRWKQTCTCPICGYSAWREVETDTYDPEPDIAALAARARCTQCGHRPCTATQEQRPPRHFDQMLPGGLRWGLVGFHESAARDAEIAAAIERRAAAPTETYAQMRARMEQPREIPRYKARRRSGRIF